MRRSTRCHGCGSLHLTTRGSGGTTPPLMRHIDPMNHPGCVLHMILAISGQFYKRAVAQEVKTIKQADSISTYLRGWLHMCTSAPQR